MSLITTFQANIPLIVFNSDNWNGKDNHIAVSEEILEFFRGSVQTKIL